MGRVDTCSRTGTANSSKQRSQNHIVGQGETRSRWNKMNLHKIALEEVLQLPLSCRIGQVANVEATALSSAGRGGLVGGGLVIGRLVADGGIAQSFCDVINGSIQIGGGVDGRHDECWWMKVRFD
jgi:hypothetical protein